MNSAKELILSAFAQAYCESPNADKQIDVDLGLALSNLLTPIITEREAALTAAVRREDATYIETSHPSPGMTRLANLIRDLIKPEEQSALDAYRDSVLMKQVSPLLKLLQSIKDEGYCGNFQPELCAALKGSSDAAKEA